MVLAAETVTVDITETGRITSYFNQYWVVNTDGNITINNPTDRDLYSVEIRFDLGSLTLIETSDTSYFQGNVMLVNRVPANTTISASYNIVGISLVDPALIGKGILYSAMTRLNPVIYSDSFGTLMKANLENETITGRPGRLISVTLRNPTAFQYTIVSLQVFKTPELDPNNQMNAWYIVNSSDQRTVDPDSIFVHDFIDPDSAEGEVYWLSADVYISRVTFVDHSNISRYTELNLTVPPELLNYSINTSNGSNRSRASVNEIYVKKLADRQLVTSDAPVQLSFIVNNFAAKLFDYTITDELPPGFSFTGGTGWSESNGILTYKGTVGGKSVALPTYSATLIDTDSAGLDYFASAKVVYNEQGKTTTKTVYTDTIPFIRQYMPNKKIYVQKRLIYEDDDTVTVTIVVQNLGAAPVQGLLLREYLEDSDVFSEISQAPAEKGLWEIKELKNGELWEVTYKTTTDTQLNILPGLFGVPSSDVLKSLVLENIISSAWEAVRTAGIELAGIGLLIGLPIVWFFLRKKPVA